MKRLAAFILVLLLIATLLTACGSGDSTPILGTWAWEYEGLGDVITFTFNQDGTGEMESFGETEDFTYTVSGSNIVIEIDGDTETCPYTLEEDTMTLTLRERDVTLTKR